MTRTLGAGMTASIAASEGERCQLIYLDFADTSNVDTPVYLTTASRDVSALGHTWQAVGGTMDLDALGESSDDPASYRMKLSGVDQTVIALILGSRWRGRNATIYHVGLDQTTGVVKTDPVVMFDGPMNGGFSIDESRGAFGGGTVDVQARLTSPLTELVRVRGVRCSEASHRAQIPAATSGYLDTFFQHVASLVFRRCFWGIPTPGTPFTGGTGPGLVNPGSGGAAPGGSYPGGTGGTGGRGNPGVPPGGVTPGGTGGTGGGGGGGGSGGNGWGSMPGGGHSNASPG